MAKSEQQAMQGPRTEIERKIADRDHASLLTETGKIHGHYCSYLGLGVRAGALAMRRIGGTSDGMEQLVAIVETNNCFSDGVQYTTGCSFGNNALIFRDFGKTAVTLIRRSDGKGVRVSMRKDVDALFRQMDPETDDLFKKVVKDRLGTPEDMMRMMQGFAKLSFAIMNLDDDRLFNVKDVHMELPGYAPIFDTVECSICGEPVMATRAVKMGGKDLCIPCSMTRYKQLDGSGINDISPPGPTGGRP